MVPDLLFRNCAGDEFDVNLQRYDGIPIRDLIFNFVNSTPKLYIYITQKKWKNEPMVQDGG